MRPPRSPGSAMVFALLIVLLLVPLALMVRLRLERLTHVVQIERKNAVSRRLAENMAVDFMSQFTKGMGYYEDHFAPEFLERTRRFFSSGFSEVTVTPNLAQQTVLVEARGDRSDPGEARRMTALYQFVPIIGRYVDMGIGNAIWLAPGRIRGPVWYSGSFNTAAGVIFEQPAVVGGNLTGAGLFESDVFVGGVVSGPTVLGTVYNVFIPEPLPVLDPAYFQLVSTTMSLNVPVHWEFRDSAGTGQYRTTWNFDDVTLAVTSDWNDIPPAGAVFYAQDTFVQITGILRGRVAVVSSAAMPASIDIEDNRTLGCVHMRNLRYSSLTADPNDSFIMKPFARPDQSLFVMASNLIRFTWTLGGTHFIPGAHYVQRTASVANARAPGPVKDWVGSTTNMLTLVDAGVSSLHTFDPGLVLFPPQGMPARPYLVSYTVSR